ncbi:MAG TPA: sigma-70 family RNA polymerase sigma factor [Pseudogracilibacillus sp.]|nr:sigma-70 family RNA polymerase sigma factor [Pseudogracilibacillus sp.]
MQKLLRQIKRGSEEAYDTFYETYAPLIYQIALAIVKDERDAEDVCHDVFIEVMKDPTAYDAKRGSVEAFLAVKAKSRALDFVRRKRPLLQPEFDESIATAASVEQFVVNNMERSVVRRALRDLPRKQREAIYGAYYEEKTQRELAATLDRPLGSVKSSIRYGLQKLRKHDALLQWMRPEGGGKHEK